MMKLDHLLKLLDDAQAEAVRLGPMGQGIARSIDEAATEARALVAKGGKPDEGTRPEDLSSANDG